VIAALAGMSACGSKSPTEPSAVTVTSVTVSGSNSVNVGSASTMTASARKSDGSTEDVTSGATWQSSNTAVATVSSTGRVSGVAPGSSNISAGFGGVTGQIGIQVMAVDNIQRVTVRLTSLVIVGTCDDNSIFEDAGDGEFSFRFEIVRDGGRTTIWSAGTTAFAKGSHSRDQGITFSRNVTTGEDFLLEFRGTEFDGILGADPRFDDRFTGRTYLYSGTLWTPSARSFTLGSGSCGATMNYTISSVRQ
jgi:hypothetical protein